MSLPHRHRAGGFSLIEVLVVITIVGVLAGMVTLSFSGDNPGQRLERESRRLALILALARDEAQLRGQEWGFDYQPDGWAFLRFEPGGRRWMEVEERPFERRTVAGVHLRAVGERRALATLRVATAADAGRRPAGLPDVFLFSSGEMSPLAIELSDPGQRVVWELRSDGVQPVARRQILSAGKP